MNRKQYLLSLVNYRAADIGVLKEKILSQMDVFSDEKIERLIVSFERSKERKRRIDAGDAKAVMEELKQQKVDRKRAQSVAYIRTLKTKEAKERSHDEVEAAALLRELDVITKKS